MASEQDKFLEHLYFAYDGVLRGYVTQRLGSHDDALDVVQETYERIARLVGRPETIRNPKAYLFRTATNVMSDWLRKRKSGRVNWDAEYDEATVSANATLVDDVIEYRKRVQTLNESIDRLSEKCRQVFLLRKVHGRSYKAISKEMNLSVSMIEKYMAQALFKCEKSMRVKYGENFIDL